MATLQEEQKKLQDSQVIPGYVSPAQRNALPPNPNLIPGSGTQGNVYIEGSSPQSSGEATVYDPTMGGGVGGWKPAPTGGSPPSVGGSYFDAYGRPVAPPLAPGQTALPQGQSPLAKSFTDAGVATSSLPTYESIINKLQTEEAGVKSSEDARLATIRGQISSDYATEIESERVRGEKTIGGYEAQLGVSRGLGFSSARAQFLESLHEESAGMIKDLMGKRDEALANADLASADRVSKEIKDLEERQFNLRKQAFDERYKAAEFQQRQQAQDKKTATDALDNLVQGEVPVEQITPQQKQDFESRLGLTPGSFDQVYAQKHAEDLLSKQKVLIDRAKEINDIAKTLPAGQNSFIPGTGIQIIGTKPDPKRRITKVQTNIKGKLYENAYDIDTGEFLYSIPTGKVYKTPSSGGGNKEVVTFEKEVATVRGALAKNTISWADAYNYLRAKYEVPDPDPIHKTNILDKLLHKNEFYRRDGAAKKAGGITVIGFPTQTPPTPAEDPIDNTVYEDTTE